MGIFSVPAAPVVKLSGKFMGLGFSPFLVVFPGATNERILFRRAGNSGILGNIWLESPHHLMDEERWRAKEFPIFPNPWKCLGDVWPPHP